MFWILTAAVLAPLLAEIPIAFKVPVVVLEVVLGIVIGPQILNLVQFDGFVVTMFSFGMTMTLLMAGMELDFAEIKGRPLALAVGGWIVSVLLGITVVGLLHAIPQVHAPLMVTLAMCTTGLGVLIPLFRDGNQLGTSFGRLVLASGTLGEVGPIVAMALLLSQHYSTWQEAGLLLTFIAIVAAAIAVGVTARTPKILAMLGRHMHKSTQLPVRISLLMLGALILLADRFGFESIFGAFAGGMVLGQVTRGALLGRSRGTGVVLSRPHRAGASLAVRAVFGSPVALHHRGHHRDWSKGKVDESGCRRGYDWRCPAVGFAVPNHCRLASFPTRRAQIERQLSGAVGERQFVEPTGRSPHALFRVRRGRRD
ncbi:MAG: cation:proton antiporter [Steroidobacteraceae bacterium]